MINSRDINDLLPVVKEKVLKFKLKAAEQNIDLMITSTYRDFESQHSLFCIGRTVPGTKVTNADAGDSYHNYRCAIDIVPIVHGKCVWNDDALWNKIGEIGKACGLEWAGDWKRFKEKAHFQYTNGLSLQDLKQNKTIS